MDLESKSPFYSIAKILTKNLYNEFSQHFTTSDIQRLSGRRGLKVMTLSLWIHPSKWSFWYQMKAPTFLITPVKYDMQQMLILKLQYKRKCSESSEIVVTTIITIYELSLRFCL